LKRPRGEPSTVSNLATALIGAHAAAGANLGVFLVTPQCLYGCVAAAPLPGAGYREKSEQLTLPPLSFGEKTFFPSLFLKATGDAPLILTKPEPAEESRGKR